jgi:hypothetical protein
MRVLRFVPAWVALFMLAVSLAPASADDTLTPSDEWRYFVAPYLWATGIDGDTTVRGTTIPVDVSFGDIVDDLDFAALVHFEAMKGSWGFFVDTIYMDLGDEFTVGPVSGSVSQQLGLAEAAGYRRWGSDRRAVDFLFGTRYWSADGTVNPGGILPMVKGSQSWADAMAGARVLCKPWEHWLIVFRADVAAGGSDPSYNGVLMFNYLFEKMVSIDFGYRYLDEDYETGQGANEFALDAVFDGPIVGVGFRW